MCDDGKESNRPASKCEVSTPPKSALQLVKEAEELKKKRDAGTRFIWENFR